MGRIRLFAAALTLVGGLATTIQAEENVMVVFDGSNSMWGQIDGTAKIEIARDVMSNLLGGWTEDRQVGLMAYGHRRRGDCTDIETLVAPTAGAKADIIARINAITPTGKTPLTDAVEKAATQLSYTDQPATVILISDGLESCDRDPCALAEALEKGGVGFTAHVVGFGLGGAADVASLACIAEKTGGQYLSASNAAELSQALSAVSSAVAEAPAPEPEVLPEPEPKAPQVMLNAPQSAIAGSEFTVGWNPTVEKRDFVTIVPLGTKEGEHKNYVTVRDNSEGELRAPGESGQYEIRYVLDTTRETLGRSPIEITEPEVTIDGPQSVVTGAAFEVSWTGAVHRSDFITIVPMGADEGDHANYVSVRKNSAGSLTAPADTGLYELRYVLDEGRRTLTRQTIEVTDPAVTLEAAQKVLAGQKFKVAWTGAVHRNDYITIVPVGSDEGAHENYITVREKAEDNLQAPAETGLYELRYVLKEGARTLARQAIEVTEPEVTISAPDTALAGSAIEVSWTGAVARSDYITIVPVGSDEGTNENFVTVRGNAKDNLRAPAEPGLYELRYVLNEGARTMARKAIEVTEPEVMVSAPKQIRAGDNLPVSWSGTVDRNDYVTIVPMGTPDNKLGAYFSVRDKTEHGLKAPGETGLYELRYVLREGSRVMARQMVEVLAADAALESGASLSAPETAAAGSTVEVSWNVGDTSADQRITLARGNQAIFTWITAIPATNGPPVQMPMPDQPGLYELRFLDVSNQAVLARKVIKVE